METTRLANNNGGLVGIYYKLHKVVFNSTIYIDGLAPLALRIYLFFPLYMAGSQKLSGIESTAYWFGEVLGMPFPLFFAYLAALTEYVGAILLLIGLAIYCFHKKIRALLFNHSQQKVDNI